MTKVRSFLYTRIAKPILFSFSPDQAHTMTINLLKMAGGVPGVSKAVRAFSVSKHVELEQDWMNMHFSSPVGLSAGLDKNGQAVPMMKALGFGFVEIGSVTARECSGNPKPWFFRLPKSKSLVVHAGLANHGVDVILPRLERLSRSFREDYPKIMSVARTNDQESASNKAGIDDFYYTFKKAKNSPAVQAFEINISCPNAFCGESFTKPELFRELLKKLETLKITKPVFIKMPIELPQGQLDEILKIAAESPMVTGLTFGNLRKDREGINLKDDLPPEVKGGLSGIPTRELSTKLIRDTYAKYGDRFKIIGVGGILNAKDAYEKIKAGASFVEIITGLIMNGPQLVEEINEGLVQLMKADGHAHISEAVGADHKKGDKAALKKSTR